MSLAINVTQIQEGLDGVEVFGLLTPSGNYPTGGDTLDWTTVAGANSANGRVFTPSALPVICQIAGTTGDDYGYVAGTTLANGKVKINTTSNAELGAGAYAARFTGDVNISFCAVFPKLL